jgi:MoaA/NifB/PqqE/SkfB family radical SAM enzyme
MPDIALWPNCDHKCIMCSNPVDYKWTTKHYTFEEIKKRIDSFFLWNKKQFISFADIKEDWTITWWEPTLNPDYFEILKYIRKKNPKSKLVQLTNWNNFACEEFVKKISNIKNYHIILPIHWYNQITHEKITKTKWSFKKLIKWINNIIKYKQFSDQTLEIRIIIQLQNYKYLDKIYEYLLKNFQKHIDSIVTVMIEYEWQAIDNISKTKITYADVIKKNEKIFIKYSQKFWKNKFKLYHFPLCALKNTKLWKYTRRTLDSNEVKFLEKCQKCLVKKYCMWIHKNYCKIIWENEFEPFINVKDLQIIKNNNNFRFNPISDIKNKKGSKKTVIFTGYSCNNKCRFCIDLNKRHINRTTKEILKSILLAKKDSSDILEIIWWEVTIREDFFTIMKFIKSLKFKHVYLVTNWIKLADFDFAKKFYDLWVIDSIVFSIHWYNSKLHDKLVWNSWAFEKLILWIKNWQKLWFSNHKIWTNTTIESWNYKNLLQIWKLIKKLWCLWSSEFIFADPNIGWVCDNFNKLMPKISTSAPFMRELLDWWNKNSMHYRVRYVPLCYFEKYLKNNISELKEIEIYTNVTHSAPDFHNNDVIEWRKDAWRIKPKKCEKCSLFNICEWIWKTYHNKLWDDELLPS